MTAVPVAQRMTAEEFLAQPYRDDAARRELIDGEVVVSEPKALHNHVQTRLVVELSNWIDAGEGRGQVFIPLDVKLDDLNVFVPDVSWYAASHALDIRSDPPYPVPDLAIEVRSRSTWRYNLGAKKAEYERHRLRELWLVDTAAATVLVFRRSAPEAPLFDVALELERGDVLGSPALPDFALALERLFDEQ